MGAIKKVLAEGEIPPRSVTPGAIWSDLCENVHLHYRNTRFDFSEKEWAHFRAAINKLGIAVEHESVERDYKEGDPNFLVHMMFNTPLKADSEYYQNRCTIELQKDNTVHFHYRDLRLHWSNEEFIEIARMFLRAMGKFCTLKPFPYRNVTEKITATVNIDLIQPYDEGHKPLAIDEEHRKGIDFIKSEIKRGVKIRPILVNTDGQRLDGFKRYTAHKELGIDVIDCIIDPYGQMGGQNNQSHKADENV